jgi:hypothetical protein
VLRRDPKFDPQLDPIVRVEATRLRRAIERYYAGPGATDPIIIDLPRGSYAPTFRRREIAPRRAMLSIAAFGRWADALPRPRPSASLAVLAAVAVVSIAAMFFHSRRDDSITTATVAVRDLGGLNAHRLPPGNGMPTIQIEPLRVIGSPSPNAIAAERLYAKISDAFARFDTINVASSPVPANATANTPAADPRTDYRLSGAIEYSGDAANAWFTLTSSAEGKVVWSRTFERVQPVDAEGVTEDSIVISLTNSLLQSYGVIRARDRANQLASNAGDPRYRCILEAADAIRTSDRKTYELARACLEHLTSVDPGFAVGFTFLAMIYNREFQLGYEPRPGESPHWTERCARQGRRLRCIRKARATISC